MRAGAAQFRDRSPPDPGEFALVRMQGLPDAASQGEPEADVHMPHRGRPYRLGHGEEERLVPGRRVKLPGNAEFLGGLAPDGAERMLARLELPWSHGPGTCVRR